jgi:hypothetical protein
VRDTKMAGSALVMYVGLLTGEEVLAEAESQARPRRRNSGRCGRANLSQLRPALAPFNSLKLRISEPLLEQLGGCCS